MYSLHPLQKNMVSYLFAIREKQIYFRLFSKNSCRDPIKEKRHRCCKIIQIKCPTKHWRLILVVSIVFLQLIGPNRNCNDGDLPVNKSFDNTPTKKVGPLYLCQEHWFRGSQSTNKNKIAKATEHHPIENEILPEKT